MRIGWIWAAALSTVDARAMPDFWTTFAKKPSTLEGTKIPTPEVRPFDEGRPNWTSVEGELFPPSAKRTVRNAFRHAWAGYREFAWDFDNVKYVLCLILGMEPTNMSRPRSKTGHNPRYVHSVSVFGQRTPST